MYDMAKLSLNQMSSSFNYTLGKIFAEGSYCAVMEAYRVPDGQIFVIKKSRTSLRIKRTILRHEARIMQSLEGHPSLPKLLGHGRTNHFEVIAMERLGDSIKMKVTSSGNSILPITVARIGDQMLSALHHLHAHGIVHRDIKPSNILLSLQDPSRVILIDFNISIRVWPTQLPQPPNPHPERRLVVGSLPWCSLNAHKGLSLRTQDDVESLAYTMLYLLRAGLPWMSSVRNEHPLQAVARVYGVKQTHNGSDLSDGFSAGFGDILDRARYAWSESDTGGILDELTQMMHQLASFLGLLDESMPLDWSSGTRTVPEIVKTPPTADPYTDEDGTEDADEDEDEEYSNSYWQADFYSWLPMGYVAEGRSKELTFPIDEGVLLDEQILNIPVVHPYPLDK